MINAMSVDVEDYFHVSAFAKTVDRSDWERFPFRVADNTYRLLELFDNVGIRATFFVLGWVAERNPSLIRAISGAGHEIACHGYSHRLIYEQTVPIFRRETSRAKSVLEDLVQRPVNGYRAASYSITNRSQWALDVLVEAGFEYDSSIFPIRHDRYGIPGATRMPHRLKTPKGNDIIEFPLSTANLFGAPIPVAGGGYFRLFPYGLTRAGLLDINNREGRPFVFYIHPWEIDPEQPRIAAPWFSRFRHYNNLHRSLPRLRRLLSDFRFDTLESVLGNLGFRFNDNLSEYPTELEQR